MDPYRIAEDSSSDTRKEETPVTAPPMSFIRKLKSMVKDWSTRVDVFKSPFAKSSFLVTSCPQVLSAVSPNALAIPRHKCHLLPYIAAADFTITHLDKVFAKQ